MPARPEQSHQTRQNRLDAFPTPGQLAPTTRWRAATDGKWCGRKISVAGRNNSLPMSARASGGFGSLPPPRRPGITITRRIIAPTHGSQRVVPGDIRSFRIIGVFHSRRISPHRLPGRSPEEVRVGALRSQNGWHLRPEQNGRTQWVAASSGSWRGKALPCSR